MSRFTESARVAVLTMLVVVLTVVVLGIVIRRVLFLLGLVVLVVLGLRFALGGSDRTGEVTCDSCGREIPANSRICPHCFELQKLDA